MIGENIKRIRRSRGLTQQMMAEKMHVNQNTISSWETNRTEPNMGMIEAMAEILGCSKSDIIGEHYYINARTAQMARKIQESKEPSAFFDAAQDASGTNMEIPIALGMLGLRRSEICGLELSDLDGSILHIHSVVVYGADAKPVRKQTPKTDESDRYIRIPDELADQIRKQGYITHMRPDAITRGFQRLIQRGKYPHIRFHDLRAYSISIGHAIGIPDIYLQHRGGWSTPYAMQAFYKRTISAEETKFTDQINAHFSELVATDVATK